MGYLTCPMCEKYTFSDVRELQQKVAITLRKPHPCPICSAQIPGLQALHVHLANHLPETNDLIKDTDNRKGSCDHQSIAPSPITNPTDNNKTTEPITTCDNNWNQNTYSPECIPSFEKLEINDNGIPIDYHLGFRSNSIDQSPCSSQSQSCSISRSTSQRSLLDDGSCMSESPCGSVSCEICGLVFSSEHFLNLHKDVVHSQNNGFEVSCKHCNSKYRDLESYRNHIRQDHSERRYLCEKCPKSFKMKGSLVVHTSMFHDPSSPSICHQCKKKFSSKARKELHERRVHGQNLRQDENTNNTQSSSSLGEAKTWLHNLINETNTAVSSMLPPAGPSFTNNENKVANKISQAHKNIITNQPILSENNSINKQPLDISVETSTSNKKDENISSKGPPFMPIYNIHQTNPTASDIPMSEIPIKESIERPGLNEQNDNTNIEDIYLTKQASFQNYENINSNSLNLLSMMQLEQFRPAILNQGQSYLKSLSTGCERTESLSDKDKYPIFFSPLYSQIQADVSEYQINNAQTELKKDSPKLFDNAPINDHAIGFKVDCSKSAKVIGNAIDRHCNRLTGTVNRQMSPVAVVSPQPQKTSSQQVLDAIHMSNISTSACSIITPHTSPKCKSFKAFNTSMETESNNSTATNPLSNIPPLTESASIQVHTASSIDPLLNDENKSFTVQLTEEANTNASNIKESTGAEITVKIGSSSSSSSSSSALSSMMKCSQSIDIVENVNSSSKDMSTNMEISTSYSNGYIPKSSHKGPSNSFKKDCSGNRGSEGKQWECEVCKKCFTTKYFLKKHNRLHTGETPYTCGECGKTFTFQQSYHKHVLYHSDEKPHRCTYCGRSFKEMSTLHNHVRIHTGEKPFTCETCGKAFRQRVSYLVHQRIHTGVLPYSCNVCQRAFRYKVSLRSHKCDGPKNITNDGVLQTTSTSDDAITTPMTSSVSGDVEATNKPITSTSSFTPVLNQSAIISSIDYLNSQSLILPSAYPHMVLQNPIIQQIYQPLIRNITSLDATDTGSTSCSTSSSTRNVNLDSDGKLINSLSSIQGSVPQLLTDVNTSIGNKNCNYTETVNICYPPQGNNENKFKATDLKSEQRIPEPSQASVPHLSPISMDTDSEQEVFLKNLFS